MPELPEVETVARQLAPRLVGRRLRHLRLLDPLLRRGPTPRLAGRAIEAVERSGKRVLFRFSPQADAQRSLWLAVHLRMTGRLLVAEAGARVPRAHLRARFGLDAGSLLFYDTRRFGTLQWYRSAAETDPGGIDPLSPRLTAARLQRLLGDSRQPIKTWLLRQDRLVGLGNIYASEILFASAISPLREARDLGRDEATRLLRVTRRILRRAIRNCGTTFSDFQDANGVTGSYQRFLAVYGRESEPCVRCGATIRRLVQQQRSTFYCGECQA